MPVLAAGCYNKTTGLYSIDGQLLCLLTGQAGGVTQVKYSKLLLLTLSITGALF